MAKPKTRVRRLAEVLEQLQRSQDALQAIDLRTCRGPVRDHIKSSRENIAASIATVEAALRADVPDVRRIGTPSS